MINIANPRVLRWSGGEPFLNTPTVTRFAYVTLGRYGGTTATGATKDEDAAWIFAAPASWG